MEIHRTKSPPLNDLQAGGHGGDKSVIYEGRFVKKLSSESEVEWYKRITEGSLSCSCVGVCPKFCGTETRRTENGKELLLVVLENIHCDMRSFVIVLLFWWG